MTHDLPPLEPCPSTKRGAHHFEAILPGEDSGDVTLFCVMCGALRRVPANGALVSESLDGLDVADIVRAVNR